MISATMPTYARAGIALERGEGVYLYATDGRRYLDFGAGVAVTALGHCHPRLVKALTEQAATLWHCSNLYRIPAQERLAERLVEASFADSVFFCNSGAEAVECGLKLVRRYQYAQGKPERFRVITCEGAFHGRTLATIAAGGQEKHLKGFGPQVDGFDHVAFGNLNEARAAVGPATAAVLVEPVQGEGGVRPMDPAYLKGLRRLCDEFGLLLFFDEVQTGIGRTGKLFAYEWSGVEPDVMAVAKGLGGGFPVGACLATERVAKAMDAGSHGSTFGGTPFVTSVALATLTTIIGEKLPERAGRLGRELMDALRAIPSPLVKEVRGRGLLVGVELVKPAAPIVDACRERGLLVLSAGEKVVRLAPPLIVESGQVQQAVEILNDALTKAAG